jgi:hypothetical protein
MISRYLAPLLLTTLLFLPLAQLRTAAQDANAIGVAPAAGTVATSPALTAPAAGAAATSPTLAPPAGTPVETAPLVPVAAAAPTTESAVLPPPEAAAVEAPTSATAVLPPAEAAPTSLLATDTMTSQTAPAAGTETQGPAAAIDYEAFWYSKDPLDETKTVREQITSAEYERRKGSELETKWTALYTDLLNGSYAKAVELGYPPDKATLMIQMDPVTYQRISESPTYKADVIKQMAEWSLFYDQLDLWNKYVEESVLREKLADSEKSEYNPATVETDLTSVYDSLQNHAKLKAEKLLRLYTNPNAVRPDDAGLMDRVEKDRQARNAYEGWLKDREKAMLAFADLWRHQYDGSEIWVNGTQYLVRNLRDVPRDPDDDLAKTVVPERAVLLNVAKEKTVTPFDLIRNDGSLKTVDNQEK